MLALPSRLLCMPHHLPSDPRHRALLSYSSWLLAMLTDLGLHNTQILWWARSMSTRRSPPTSRSEPLRPRHSKTPSQRLARWLSRWEPTAGRPLSPRHACLHSDTLSAHVAEMLSSERLDRRLRYDIDGSHIACSADSPTLPSLCSSS